jgi:tripartite-type tricarboxylate transporter receptor subunit TctC
LIALAKARPGELNYSTTTSGSAAHIAGELLKSMAGINMVCIGYKGNGPALLAAESGEVQVSLISPGSATPAIKSGKVRALAVTGAKPSVLFPNLPTVAASGLPGYESVNITGLFAPAKTPETIIRRLNQEIVRVLNSADVKAKILSTGVEPVTSSPEELAAAIKLDIARLGKVIKEAGIKAE